MIPPLPEVLISLPNMSTSRNRTWTSPKGPRRSYATRTAGKAGATSSAVRTTKACGLRRHTSVRKILRDKRRIGDRTIWPCIGLSDALLDVAATARLDPCHARRPTPRPVLSACPWHGRGICRLRVAVAGGRVRPHGRLRALARSWGRPRGGSTLRQGGGGARHVHRLSRRRQPVFRVKARARGRPNARKPRGRARSLGACAQAASRAPASCRNSAYTTGRRSAAAKWSPAAAALRSREISDMTSKVTDAHRGQGKSPPNRLLNLHRTFIRPQRGR